MNRAVSTLVWAILFASAFTGGAWWLFEIHLGASIWNSFLWWLYPFFWILLAGGWIGELNKHALEQGQLRKLG